MADALKPTWITRRIPADLVIAWDTPQDPTIGDLLLCEVLRTGMHGRVETAAGARMKLYSGDRIVCAVGNRYATSLLEAVGEVAGDRVDMISASGLCGRVTMRSREAGTPTKLRIIGQAFSDGVPVNLRSFTLPPAAATTNTPRWVVVVGSAMDSGKTTACASLIRGLTAAGRSVGAAKLTGTSSARDFGSYRDAGAVPVLDFLDAGWASTAGCTPADLDATLVVLAGHLRAAGVEWAVMEIADGLLQPETNALLESMSATLGSCDLILTVNESLAAVAGVELLSRIGHRPLAVSGIVTNSPLARREVELACRVPCVPTSELGRRLAAGGFGSPLQASTGRSVAALV
jgi:hypothetical protein